MESAISRKILIGSIALALPLLVSSCQTMPPEELCDRFWYQAKQSGSTNEARTLFEQAIEQGRRTGNGVKLAKVILDYGDFLLRDREPSAAVDQALSARQSLDATRSSPTFGSAENREREVMIAQAQFLLAKAYSELGRLEDAKKEYEQALALHDRVLGNMTKKLEMMRQYISLLKKMGKTEEASELEIKQQALYTTVDDCDRLVADSDKALEAGDIPAARRSLRIARLAAAKFGPSSNRFRDMLLHSAILEFVSGDMAKTKALLNEALDSVKHPIGNRSKRDQCRENVLLGFCYELDGNMVEANKLYELSSRQYPGGPSATLYTVAGYLVTQHKSDLLIKVAKRAYALCEALPDSVRKKQETSNKLLLMIADALLDTGRYDEARKYYKLMLDAATNSPAANVQHYRDCILRFSDYYRTSDNVQGDLDFLSRLVIPKRFNAGEVVLIRAAIAQRQASDLVLVNKLRAAEIKVLESLEFAKQSKDKNVICMSHLFLADILRVQERFDQAEENYKYVINYGIDSDVKVFEFEGSHHLAELYMRQKRYLEARDKFLQAWRLLKQNGAGPASRSTDLAIRVSESEMALGRLDKAEKWAETARREFKRDNGIDPNFGSIYLYICADIAALRKDYGKALKLYKADLAYCEAHHDKVSKGMLENSIGRLINLADKMFERGLKKESLEVVDVSLNAYVRDKVTYPHGRARLERWIVLARKEGFDAQAERWRSLLKTRPAG